MRDRLVAEMQSAGCLRLPRRIGPDPLLRERLGQPGRLRATAAFCVRHCRPERKDSAWDGAVSASVDPRQQRIHLLWNGYAHAVQPPEAFARHEIVPPDRDGEPVVSFTSTDDPHYQAMLTIIRQARAELLAAPRVDVPGAEVQTGTCRLFVPPVITDEVEGVE